MKKLSLRILVFILLLVSIKSFASFIGKADNVRDKKITLKNFSRNKYHINAYPSFHLSDFHFNGSQDIYQVNSASSFEGQSIIRLQNGNTTYVYPYKYKVKVPLFITPSRNNINSR